MSSQELDGVTRRRFLSHSFWSVGLLTSPDWATRHGSQATRVALSFWRESESLTSLDAISHTTLPFFVDETRAPLPQEDGPAAANAVLLDARRVASGDARFVGGHARLRVHGMFVEPDASLADVPSLSIYVRSAEDDEAPDFHAWSFESNAVLAMTNVSRPVAFDVPVSSRGLRLALRTGESSVEMCLSPGTALFSPKLRRGIYFLSWARSANASLSGRQDVHWAVEENGAVRTRLTSTSKRSAPLAHVLVSIDRIPDSPSLIAETSDS